MRRLSDSPAALGFAARGAMVAPGAVRLAIRYAGDGR
jgi:hypothetical protein